MTKLELEKKVADLTAQNSELLQLLQKAEDDKQELQAINDDLQAELDQAVAQPRSNLHPTKPEIEHHGRILQLEVPSFFAPTIQAGRVFTAVDLRDNPALIDAILSMDGQQILTYKNI